MWGKMLARDRDPWSPVSSSGKPVCPRNVQHVQPYGRERPKEGPREFRSLNDKGEVFVTGNTRTPTKLALAHRQLFATPKNPARPGHSGRCSPNKRKNGMGTADGLGKWNRSLAVRRPRWGLGSFGETA